MNRLANVKWLCRALTMTCAALCAATAASAATITVNALTDDIFPDGLGAIFDINGAPVALAQPKCTLRMALASANLDLAVGGANGCAAGSGPDTIVFAASLNLATVPGTISLADKGMNEAPATYVGVTVYPALIASRELTITGPGSARLTIDGGVAGTSGRRLLNVDDGDATVDRAFAISGVRLLRGRTIDRGAGCMASAESTTITDVIFESCESVGGPNRAGFAGALAVANANAPGNYRPAVTVSNSVFVTNRATRGTNVSARAEVGAAAFGFSTGMVSAVSLTGVRVLGNSAEQVGGITIYDATTVIVTDSQFLSNAATGGPNTVTPGLSGGRWGGLTVSRVSGNVTISSAAFIGNTAFQERAGFSVLTVGGTTTIDDVTVQGNLAGTGRIGGFEVLTDNFDVNGNCLGTSRNPVIISNVDIKANAAATSTAAFRVQCSGAVSITNSNIEANDVFGSDVAGSGGNSAGAIISNLAVTMTDVRVRRNKTFKGAIDGGFGVMLVQNNTTFDGSRLFFRDNYAQQNEGALTLAPNGPGRAYTLADSAFVDNSADGAFPALFLVRTGNYTVRNSTFSGNKSAGGGAINVNMNVNAVGESTVVALENVTSARNGGLALNAANSGGAGVASGTLAVRNSILGSGANGIGSPSANFPTIAGVTYSVANSLVENSGGVPAGTCGVNGNLCSVDARLESVGSNGGFPTLTHALKPGSPALDSGNSAGVPAFDQRGTGFPRIVGTAVDMGAFESPVLSPPCSLDVDGNGAQDPLTDGLLILRALFGLTGTAVTNGAVGSTAVRSDWPSIRAFLNGICGANFAP